MLIKKIRCKGINNSKPEKVSKVKFHYSIATDE